MKTVRLDRKLENSLRRYAHRNNIPESRVIREALEEYLSRVESTSEVTSYTLGKDYFGKVGSGTGTGADTNADIDEPTGKRSQDYKNRLKTRLREKTSR